MIRAFDAFSLPLLRWFDPEDAHRMAIQGLRLLPPVKSRADDHKLAVRAFGLNFPNPIGMAAGFDKNAEVPDALLRLGFGFVEIGTVTPKPQVGNPRPRLFRLERDEAVINRLGFNNDGAEAALRRLAARAHHGGIIGVNVGANKDSTDRVADYVKLIETFAPVASYFTVNVSSRSIRNSRGRGLPPCGLGVTEPISTKPKPSRNSASGASALLSKPAAMPIGLGKFRPKARTASLWSSARDLTGGSSRRP